MLSAFMGFLEPGDEVIVFEPFFDQYISNIEMPGGKVVYVPLHPPKDGATKTTSAGEWKLDMKELESKITDRTRMMVINTPHNPVGKVFSREELQAIGDLCVKHNIIILSDEVYDRLYYVPFTRMATLSPEIAKLTLTVGSGGKCFYCTGWRVGYLIGPEHLIKYVSAAHTRICFSSVSPLQEATAVAFEEADKHDFWEKSKKDLKGKMDRFNQIWDELGLPYSDPEGGYFVLVNLAKVKLPEVSDDAVRALCQYARQHRACSRPAAYVPSLYRTTTSHRTSPAGRVTSSFRGSSSRSSASLLYRPLSSSPMRTLTLPKTG